MIKQTLIFLALFLIGELAFSQKPIEVNCKRNKDKSVDFSYQKNIPGTYSLIIEFSAMSNAHTPRKTYALKSSHGNLFRLKPINDKCIGFSYRYTYRRGISNPKVDSTFTYLFPFKDSKSVRVNFLQNVDHRYFSKELPQNWKAFEFSMDQADTVCAVRRGIVVEVTDEFNSDTTMTYSFTNKKNVVVVEHPDGTFARYRGFEKGKIFVEPGDRLIPNEPMGVLAQYDDRGFYVLKFAIYNYLSDKSTIDCKRKTAFVDPYFLTTTGKVRLDAHQEYTSKVTDEQITAELRKKEIKRCKKQQKIR